MSSFYIVQRTCGARLWGSNLAWFVFLGGATFSSCWLRQATCWVRRNPKITPSLNGTLISGSQSSECPSCWSIWARSPNAPKKHIYVANWLLLAISGQPHDDALAVSGSELFLDNFAACHGDAGAVNRDLVAPNLSDAIWLHGDAAAALEEAVRYARFGVMPPWGERRSVPEIKAFTAYVHQLGGGE